MKSPVTKAKEFIAQLMQYFYEEFQNSIKPTLTVAKLKLEPSAKAFYIKSQKE